MRRVFAIGESVLDIFFDSNDKPVKSFVGGRVVNAAAMLGKNNVPVSMVSECCNDHTGDIVMKFLTDNGVDTTSVDRFTDGATAVSLIFNRGDNVVRSNYMNYPTDRFDVVWPRFNDDDVMLFGSFYSIEESVREPLYDMLTYVAERKILMIYLPGCQHGINCRLTKVMPAILENIELSNIVVANRSDIDAIFPGEGPDKAFRNHMECYNPLFLFIGDDYSVTIYSRGSKVEVPAEVQYSGEGFLWQSRFVSTIIKRLITDGVTKADLSHLSGDKWEEITREAMAMASRENEAKNA